MTTGITTTETTTTKIMTTKTARQSSSRRIIALLLPAIPALLLGGACSGEPGQGGGPNNGNVDQVRSDKVRVAAPTASAADLAQLSADNRHFAVDLYQAVRSRPGNLVFSPESISIALSMTLAGAAGQTAAQMKATLRLSLPTEKLHPAFDALDLALASRGSSDTAGAFKLKVSNALWGQRGFAVLPTYLDLLAENYGAGMNLVDFQTMAEAARLTINQWVSDQTAKKIPELLPQGSVDPSTRLVLTNAVYFKADWTEPFAASLTSNATFHTTTGTVSTPMMSGPESVSLWSGTGYQAAALPYVGNTTSMVLIVPDAGTFDAFEAGLTLAQLDAVLAQTDKEPGALSMPKFQFKQGLPAGMVLKTLGMTDAFDPSAADLSGIDGSHDLFIQDVVHQAMIAVDEKGTEAAAATGIIAGTTSAPRRRLEVDRPFLFLIRDDATQSVIFLGRVVDPSN